MMMIIAGTLRIFLLLLTCVQCARMEGSIDGIPCIPIEGKTALIIGQDYYSVLNYTAVLGDSPLGVMSYTGKCVLHTLGIMQNSCDIM